MDSGKASELDWSRIRHFSPKEFPNGVLPYMNSKIIVALDKIRGVYNEVIHPSPLYEGWARHGGSSGSRHYVGAAANPIRLSDAADIFPMGNPLHFWELAVTFSTFGGVGIYEDTVYDGSPRVMFHLDLRPVPYGKLALWWARRNGKYYYPINGGEHRTVFYNVLSSLAR